MTTKEILTQIEAERTYQDAKWGKEFDQKNTVNDWVSYVSLYLGKSLGLNYQDFDEAAFRKNMLKVATLAVACLEQGTYAPRHYDKELVK